MSFAGLYFTRGRPSLAYLAASTRLQGEPLVLIYISLQNKF
jgi:hypothetical protein